MPEENGKSTETRSYIRACISDIRTQVNALNIQHTRMQTLIEGVQATVEHMQKTHKDDKKELYTKIGNLSGQISGLHTKFKTHTVLDNADAARRADWNRWIRNLIAMLLVAAATAILTHWLTVGMMS